jgi:hypothetical protein
MFKQLVILPIAMTVAVALASPASAAACRDAHGKFVKCAQKAAPATHCKDAKGKFVKCNAPGAKPAK